MSNVEKTAWKIQASCPQGRVLTIDQALVVANVLEEAGLLMPDLPEPEVRHLEEVNTDVLAWKSDHIEAGVYKNRIVIDDPPRNSMTPAEARELALMLLAAADYAEKEQDNE